MPTYNLYNGIENGVQLLNSRINNKAYSFRVYSIDSYCTYVVASFDFAYYTNLHIECRNSIFTNLKENQEWPDVWHEDQIYLMNKYELDYVINSNQLSIPDDSYFGILFNLSNRANSLNIGAVICNELHIRYEYPNYADEK